MSLEQVEKLLKSHRISPNKGLGQNFLVDSTLYPKLCTYAKLTMSDMVLDVGAGFGFLTHFLAEKCRTVIAVERDSQVVAVLREQTRNLSNVTVVEGDVLKVQLPEFNKVIALPPYYLSSNLVMWLLGRYIDCAVLVVQKEFAQRLVAAVGTEDYSWLTVFVYQHALVEVFDEVPKGLFYPPPKVDSIIIRLTPLKTKGFEIKDEECFVRLVKWLFTERNKKLAKALSPFLRSNFNLSKQEAEKLAKTIPQSDKRVRELLPKDFGAITNALPD